MRGGLLVRGMRWRLGGSLLTVLTASIAVATAVLGPLYLHTAGDSVLRRIVASAAVQDRGVTVSSQPGDAHPLIAVRRAERTVQSAGGGRRWFGAPITTVLSGVVVGTAKSELLARTGICGVLRFTEGDCDLGAGDAVMTERGARQVGARVGTTVDVSVTGLDRPLRLTVTGIVATPDVALAYWWGDGQSDFPFGQSSGSGSGATDPMIVSPATALAVPAADVPTAIGQVPLRAGAVDVEDESTVRRVIGGLAAELPRQGISAGTRLPSLLSQADAQRREMTTIVAIAAGQLVLLAVWVLGSLLVRSGDARRAETRVARLRGFPALSLVWVTAAEPALLCLLGAVLGVIAAWVSVVIARAQLLVPSAVIAFDGWTFAALGSALAGIAGALGLVTLRLLRAGDGGTGPARTAGGASVLSRAADAVMVVLAIVALIALTTTGALGGGRSDPLASAAPGLIALGTAVLAVELILSACRLGITLTADSGRVAGFLGLRQTVRRPAVLRQARVLIIALGVACFASVAWSVARTNRSTAAAFAVGAPAVVTVAPVSPTTLERAVGVADPHGRFAMAAIDLDTPSTTLLAVDARRLPAVASWPSGISARALPVIARTLSPVTVPAVSLSDGPVRVRARTAIGPRAGVDLSIWVFDDRGGGTAVVDLGRLHAGVGTYGGDIAGLCPGGCQLAGLGVLPAAGGAPATGTVTLTIDRVSSAQGGGASRAVAADLFPGGWRATAAGVRVSSPRPHALTVTVSGAAIAADAGATGTTTAPMVSPADHPPVLPALVTTELRSLNAGAVGALSIQGLDGNTIDERPSAIASALPRVGADATMIDLGLLSRAQVGPTSPDASDEVWLGQRAPTDALALLRSAGLSPTRVQRASTVLSQLQRSAPALADDFLLMATIAALILAAASTLGAFGATTRERATELASLEVAGVHRRALLGSLGVESAILTITALSGVAVGVLAAAIAVPSLPELASAALVPLRYGLPLAVIAVTVLAVIVAVALAGAGVAAVLLRRMSPALLRMAPDDLSP